MRDLRILRTIRSGAAWFCLAALAGCQHQGSVDVIVDPPPAAGSEFLEEPPAEVFERPEDPEARNELDTGTGDLETPDAALPSEAESEPNGESPPKNPTSPRGISDEQDFDAVSQRETIETDAERLERQRQEFQPVSPRPLPDVGERANLAQYAVESTHPAGTELYRRSWFRDTDNLSERCGAFGSANEAQQAFLDHGGPEEDKFDLDPDGDGYACAWTPGALRELLLAE